MFVSGDEGFPVRVFLFLRKSLSLVSGVLLLCFYSKECSVYVPLVVEIGGSTTKGSLISSS